MTKLTYQAVTLSRFCINITIQKEYKVSRPKPKILIEVTNKSTYKTEQILSADAVYAVFFQGKPVNLRTVYQLIAYPGPKYKKSSFGNKGHAFNLAKKLNEQFKTNDFAVYELTQGTLITKE